MDRQEQVIAILIADWDDIVSDGIITYDELHDGLLDQVTGSMDLSADELTDDLAELMGWDPSAITEDQYKEWRQLVNEAATRYISR